MALITGPMNWPLFSSGNLGIDMEVYPNVLTARPRKRLLKIQILPAFFSKAGLVLSIVAFAFVFNAVSDTAEQLEQKLMALVPAPVVAN